jgi:hypothetical protein
LRGGIKAGVLYGKFVLPGRHGRKYKVALCICFRGLDYCGGGVRHRNNRAGHGRAAGIFDDAFNSRGGNQRRD